MSNVISSLTFGRRFEYDDPRLLKLLDRLHAGLEEDQGLLREVRGEAPGSPAGRAPGRRTRPKPGLRDEGVGRGGCGREALPRRKAWRWGSPIGGSRRRRAQGGGAGRRLWNLSTSVTGSH